MWGGCGSGVEPASCFWRSIPQVCIDFGKDTDPWTAPDVLVGSLHGSLRHQCRMYAWITVNRFGQKCLLNVKEDWWMALLRCLVWNSHFSSFFSMVSRLLTNSEGWILLYTECVDVALVKSNKGICLDMIRSLHRLQIHQHRSIVDNIDFPISATS